MDNKFLLQDIADGLVTRKGMTKKDAETFVRTIFEVIEQYLIKDKMVKIKGFGTFKVVAVSNRESVNVNTGERITIKGHSKVTFTPDATLRDTVNKPFADFETTILNEMTSTDQMERINGVIPPPEEKEEDTVVEEVAAPVEDPTPAEEPAPTEEPAPAEEPTPIEEPAPVEVPAPVEETAPAEESTPAEEPAPIEEPAPAEDPAPEEEEEPMMPVVELAPIVVTPQPKEEEQNSEAQPVQSEEQKPEPQPVPTPEETQPKTSSHFVKIAAAVVILLLVGIAYWMGSRNSSSAHEQAIAAAADTAKKVAEDIIKQQESNVKPEDTIPQMPKGDFVIVGTRGTYEVQTGDILSKVANRIYGDRHMYRYIAFYNNISPDSIETGMVLKLPELKAK